MPTDRIEAVYAAAKQQYADHGVDTGAALAALAQVPVSLHCWQGDDVGGFENFGESLGGGIAATGNYPGRARTPDELQVGRRQGAVAHPRHAPLQSARLLRRLRRQARRPRRDWTGAFRRMDRLGEVAGDRPRLQPDVLLASQGSRQLHAGTPGRRRPQVLDTSRDRVPSRRRRDGRGARHAMRDEPLDPGRHEGHAGRSPASPRASDRVAGRNLPESRRSRAQPRRARRQAVRPRHRELHGRLARVLFRLRGCPASCSTRSTRATITRRRPSPTRSAPC